MFIPKHLISKPPLFLLYVFILSSNIHEQNTRFAPHGLLTKPTCSTSKYGVNAFASSAIASWNFFQKQFPSNNLRQTSYSQLKELIKNYFSIPTTKFLFKRSRWFLCLRLFYKYLEGRLFCLLLNLFFIILLIL